MDEILISGSRELGLELPEGATALFGEYYRLLTERGAVMNLTAIEGEENVARLHFLDCLALLGAADFKNASVVDVGAGAGFPGTVLKLGEPSIRLTSLDSLKKRVDFLAELSETLGLRDVRCLRARAEEAPPELRESFDIAVSRAVAELRVLYELTLPLVRVGGLLVAMKGPTPEDELERAAPALKPLGGELAGVRAYKIPGTEVRHTIVLVRKTAATPARYPRRYARILDGRW